MKLIRKPYDSLLPFLVVEALSADSTPNSKISVKICENGWAWLASGRKLFVWRFKQVNAVKTKKSLSPCYELNLVLSEHAHSADLIHVFHLLHPSGQTGVRTPNIPAAIAISPEGVIRFWHNIANERYIEAMVGDLQGQECHSLVPISPTECALVTTTGTVFLIRLEICSPEGRSSLKCSLLSTPQSLLSGLGRRMTSLFFGVSGQGENNETQRSLIAVPKMSSDHSKSPKFYILSSGLKLQEWSRSEDGTSQLAHVWELQETLLSAFNERLSDGTSDLSQLSIWPIDMITTKTRELMILLAGLNRNFSDTLHYATAKFAPNSNLNNRISSFNLWTSYNARWLGNNETQLLSLKFIERRTTSQSVSYLYDRNKLLLAVDGDISDSIEYGAHNDGILGAAFIDGHPLLFTQSDGLVSIAIDSVMRIESPQLAEISDPESEDSYGEDAYAKMKSAFQAYARQDLINLQHIIRDIMKSCSQANTDPKNDVNEAAVTLSNEIIADNSLQDVRVPEMSRTAYSHRLDHLIKLKYAMHQSFIEFLRSSQLWSDLDLIKRKKQTFSTHLMIQEHHEKLLLAMVLDEVLRDPNLSKFISPVIQVIVDQRRLSGSRGTSTNVSSTNMGVASEIFMKQVNQLDELFSALLHYQMDLLQSIQNPSTSAIIDIIVSVNDLLGKLLKPIVKLRRSKEITKGVDLPHTDYELWSSSTDKSFLMEQFNLTVRYGVESALATASIVDSLESKDRIYESLINIADLIFEEHSARLSMSNENSNPNHDSLVKAFEADRLKCFKPLIAARYKQAAKLADKYRDFYALTRICESCDSQDILKLYLDKYDDYAEYLFNYFMKEGKQSQLMATLPSSKLSAFLQEHNQLQWLHQIELGHYGAASTTLSRLAGIEQIPDEKRKTLLSLSKLASLAAGQS